MRGYAIGVGAGTQVLTHLPWFILLGKPGELARGLLMGAGWVINLAVAEWIIRKEPPRRSAGGARMRTLGRTRPTSPVGPVIGAPIRDTTSPAGVD